MEIHRQTCQLCGSKQMRDLIVREPGEPDKVFVQCDQCKEMVARYVIAPNGYFHAHKNFESYLRGIHRGGDVMSGRSIQAEYEKTQEICENRFRELKEKLKEMEKN